MNYFFLKRYFSYLLTSRHKTGHGIHSPFVYKLISEVFQNKTAPNFVNRIEKYRSALKKSNIIIDVADQAKGSFNKQVNKIKVSSLAKRDTLRKKYGLLLASMADLYNGKAILELGTSLGISSMYLALSADKSEITTIESCRSCADIAEKAFRQNSINNIRQYRGNYLIEVDLLLKECLEPALVYINCMQGLEDLPDLFDVLVKNTGREMAIVINNIHYSEEMEEAWELIKSDARINISIDILKFGLVFIKKGLSKQDFVIRY